MGLLVIALIADPHCVESIIIGNLDLMEDFVQAIAIFALSLFFDHFNWLWGFDFLHTFSVAERFGFVNRL